MAARFPEIEIKTYNADFRAIVPELGWAIPDSAFAFFLIDPKGWRIPLQQLRPLLRRPRSEVVFNFMFEFINRAASMRELATVHGLNELMPHSGWRKRLQDAEEQFGYYGMSSGAAEADSGRSLQRRPKGGWRLRVCRRDHNLKTP